MHFSMIIKRISVLNQKYLFCLGPLKYFFETQGLIPNTSCWITQIQTTSSYSQSLKLSRAYLQSCQAIWEANYFGIKVGQPKSILKTKKSFSWSKSILTEQSNYMLHFCLIYIPKIGPIPYQINEPKQINAVRLCVNKNIW